MTALASKGEHACAVVLVLELTAITLQLAPRKLYRTSICSRLCELVRLPCAGSEARADTRERRRHHCDCTAAGCARCE